jgi:hypothetical protein
MHMYLGCGNKILHHMVSRHIAVMNAKLEMI